jgi:aminoglycoside 3-N-acetyltransferase
MTEDLKDKWHRSGINPGDTVLLHSNIKRTLIEARRSGISLSLPEILNSFLDALGPKGTLILPLFNFDFTSYAEFDIRNTPSQMGALTEFGRIHNGSVRTGHPIYSFAVIGYKKADFEGVDNESGYAENSPFGILKRLDGKIASLDLEDQDSMTFYHHVEEVKKVDYRYFKTFKGRYIDYDGVMKDKSYKLFVRKIELGVKTDVNPAGELMWQKGLYKGCRPKVDTGLRVIRARDMFDFVENLIDRGKALGTLYSIDK